MEIQMTDPHERSTKNAATPRRLVTSKPNLEVAARIPLPPSSPGLMSPRDAYRPPYSPGTTKPSPNPLRRTSSTGLDKRSASPSLLHRASTSSLRNNEGNMSPGFTSRRASSNFGQPPTVTASSVATEFLARDLAQHGEGGVKADTIVILHDACYGHRFARPSSKRMAEQNLEYTFERPERIEATALGLSTAYIMLGGRHADDQHGPHPRHTPPTDVPFLIRKTDRALSLRSPIVTAVHGDKWMTELGQMCGTVTERLPHGKELERIAQPGTTQSKDALHSGDLYLCPESIHAFEGALGGVCEGIDAVFRGTENGTGPHQAYVSVRPPGHHCAAHMPSGFCWLNNVHVGIEYATQTYGLTHAAIIDFDLHHGDGSQAIAWSRNAKAVEAMQPSYNARDQGLKPRNYADQAAIGYFSIHDIESYPCESGDQEAVRNASVCIDNYHGQSIWNVHLEAWTTPEEFWAIYQSKYKVLLEKMRGFLQLHTRELGRQLQDMQSGQAKKNDRSKRTVPRPKAAIFISAGFDASEHENPFMQRHGKRVMTEFYARITKDIASLANETGTAVDGRIVSVLEGGYSDKALISGVMSHLCGLCDTSPHIKSENGPSQPAAGNDLGDRLKSLAIHAGTAGATYDVEWWERSRLLELELLLNPAASDLPGQEPKVPKIGGYSDPTKASTAKAIDPSKVYRSTSWSINRTHISGSASPSRAPSPPPPEVNWLVATQELCRLLVPSDRQTKSHTAEELTLSSITKKPRHTTIGLPTTEATSERQLRDRRTKTPAAPTAVTNPATNDSSHSNGAVKARVVSRSDRRKTIADLPLSGDVVDEAMVQPRARRRSSIASTMSTTSAAATMPADNIPPVPRIPSASNGVQVKKVRMASGSKPVSPVIPVRKSSGPAVSAPAVKEINTPKADSNTDVALDELTTGLKRIRINVPSKEEYAARQVKKAPAATKATSARTATRKPATEAKSTTVKKTVPRAISKELKAKAVTAPPIVSTAQEAGSNAGHAVAAAAVSHSNVIDMPSQARQGVAEQHTLDSGLPVTGISQAAGLQSHELEPFIEYQISGPAKMNGIDPAAAGSVPLVMPVQPPVPAYEKDSQGPDSSAKVIPSFSATGHIPFAPAAPLVQGGSSTSVSEAEKTREMPPQQ